MAWNSNWHLHMYQKLYPASSLDPWCDDCHVNKNVYRTICVRRRWFCPDRTCWGYILQLAFSRLLIILRMAQCKLHVCLILKQITQIKLFSLNFSLGKRGGFKFWSHRRYGLYILLLFKNPGFKKDFSALESIKNWFSATSTAFQWSISQDVCFIEWSP